MTKEQEIILDAIPIYRGMMYPTRDNILHFKAEKKQGMDREILINFMINEISHRFLDCNVVIILEKGKVIEILLNPLNEDIDEAENFLKEEIKKKEEELEMYKDMKEIVNSKVTDLAKLKQYDDLKEENRKKDKMIDLMAEELQKHIYVLYDGDTITSKKGIIQHFERKLEKQ